jgi:ribonuclease HI
LEDVVLGEAMDMVERYQITNIIFEMDSQIVVKAVKNKTLIRKSRGAIVQRWVNFLKANPNSTITWVNRDRNRVTHELEKLFECDLNKD